VLAPLVELGLGASQIVLAAGEVGSHAVELLGLRRIGAPVPHRREPAALGSQRSQASAETPLAQRELPLQLLELAFAHRDRGRAIAQHPLQVFELVAGARPVMTALYNPLRHRASNVHALCGNGRPQYDQPQWGKSALG
jgi:hypothetical protein